MNRPLMIAAAALVLMTAAHAAPPKKWFLEVSMYGMSNRGTVDSDKPEIRYLEHVFDTRNECMARWRTFRKKCEGLIQDNNNVGYFSIAKFTGACRQWREQPGPVLVPPERSDDDTPGIQREQECAK